MIATHKPIEAAKTTPNQATQFTYQNLLDSGITLEDFARACGIKNCRQWKTDGIPYKHYRIVQRMMENQADYKKGLFCFTNQLENACENHNKITLENTPKIAQKQPKNSSKSLHVLYPHKINENNDLTPDFIHPLGKIRNSKPPLHDVRLLLAHISGSKERKEQAKKAAIEAGKMLVGRTDLQQNRAVRYVRQNIARVLLYAEKAPVCSCGRHVHITADGIEIYKNYEGGKSFYKGVQVCGRVWQCAVCAAKISERRRAELVHATTQHLDRCGADSLVFVTLTFPHSQHDNLKQLMLSLAKATIWFYGHRVYKRLAKRLDKQGYVRALEVTHGTTNGWHPHIHEIWFCGHNQSDFHSIKAEIYALWSCACKVAGLSAPSWAHGVDVRDARYAAGYITKFGDDTQEGRKWGMEDELTKSGAKKGKVGKDGLLVSRTPWQLLDTYAADGDKVAGALFIEYVAAFKGKQQVRWSDGLKDLYGIHDYTDEQLAEKSETAAYRYFGVSVQDWRVIRSTSSKVDDTRAKVLDASESLKYGDFEDFIDVLSSRQKRSESKPEPFDFGDFEDDVRICEQLLGVF
jgi:Replication protein